MSNIIYPLCIIACHGGPADHFATFVEILPSKHHIAIHASGPALKKFQDRNIPVQYPFSLDGLSPEQENRLAQEIADKCSHAKVVISDLGHTFCIKVQRALAEKSLTRIAYYDNPESFVPGGYSATAAKVMIASDKILFANANLANVPIYQAPGVEVDFGNREKIGLGYYPSTQAESIKHQRKTSQAKIRAEFFKKHGLIDSGQKIWVYFGGNNEEYFEKAFPAFLDIISDSSAIVVLQQHPGAKKQNLDAAQIKNNKVIISKISSDDAQIIADLALYYQTSMAAQFALAGIPTAQIGHKSYSDILVKNKLCPSISCETDLAKLPEEPVKTENLNDQLGIQNNWLEILENIIN